MKGLVESSLSYRTGFRPHRSSGHLSPSVPPKLSWRPSLLPLLSPLPQTRINRLFSVRSGQSARLFKVSMSLLSSESWTKGETGEETSSAHGSAFWQRINGAWEGGVPPQPLARLTEFLES